MLQVILRHAKVWESLATLLSWISGQDSPCSAKCLSDVLSEQGAPFIKLGDDLKAGKSLWGKLKLYHIFSRFNIFPLTDEGGKYIGMKNNLD